MRYTSGLQPAQSILSATPSVQNLDPIIHVNDQDMTTLARYNAKDATTLLWMPDGYGKVLPVIGSGASPVPQYGSFLYGPRDDSVYFPGAKYYRHASSSFCDPTTEDIYGEGLFTTPAVYAGGQYFFNKYNGTSGLLFGFVSTVVVGALMVKFDGGASDCWVRFNTVLPPLTTIFYSFFYDASETSQINGMQLYVCDLNDTGYSTANAPSAIGSLTNSGLFTLGTYSSSYYVGSLDYFLLASGNAVYAGGAQNLIDWAAFHRHRFHSVFGISSSKLYSLGTYTRASAAFVPKRLASGSVEYNQVGSGMPRPSNTPDAFIGILAEMLGCNYEIHSSNANNFTTKSYITTPSSVSGPIKQSAAYLIVESNDGAGPAVSHVMYSQYSIALNTLGKMGFFQFIVAIHDSGRRYIYSRVKEGGETTVMGYVDITNQVFDTYDANVLAVDSDVIGEFSGYTFKLFRYRFICKGTGSTDNRTYFWTCDNSKNITYIGDGSNNFYLAHYQFEYYPSTVDPYLWLKLDDGTGSALADSSGNSRDQTLVGSDTNFWVDGRYGANAGYFSSAVPNYISMPTSYFNANEGTWACWVKVASWAALTNSTARFLCSQHTGGLYYEHRTSISGGALIWNFANSTTYISSNIGNLTAYNGKWVHLCWSWNYPGSGNTTVKGYVNGIIVPGATSYIAGPLTVPDTALLFGRYPTTSGNLTATIADVSLYQRTLDADDIKLLYEDSPLKYQGGFSSPILTTTATAIREPDALVYPYTNTAPWGSKICKFHKDLIPGCKTVIWEISDGADPNNRIYGWVDSLGYFNVEVIVSGVSQGWTQIAQNVCDKRSWILAARWTATVLDLVIYNMTTETTYTATTALTGFPTGLDENRPAVPCNAIIGDCDDLDYYETNNRRLLFG